MITEIVRALAASGATPQMICAAVEAAEAERERITSERRLKARDKKRAQRSTSVPGTNGDNEGRMGTDGDGEGTAGDTPALSLPPTPPNSNPSPKENPPKGGQKKGTRVGDFAPSIEAAVSMGLSRKIAEAEARKFVDYFRGAAGEKGIKTDWIATWRNWVRRALEQRGIAETTPAGNERMVPKADHRWQFLVARWERENSEIFPSRAEQWPFPESWLKDANRSADDPGDPPAFLLREPERKTG